MWSKFYKKLKSTKKLMNSQAKRIMMSRSKLKLRRDTQKESNLKK